MSKVKEKVKEFNEKHPELKGDVSKLLHLAIGLGAGYFVGKKYADLRFGIGLDRLNSVKPEIFPLMQEAFDELKKK